MVRRHISDETKQIALQMAQEGLPTKAIRDRTGISERSVMRLKRTFRETGSVSRKALVIGRKRMLDILDVCFLESCIERQPDIYLKELQDLLRQRGIECAQSTISHALHRRGLTKEPKESFAEDDQDGLTAPRKTIWKRTGAVQSLSAGRPESPVVRTSSTESRVVG